MTVLSFANQKGGVAKTTTTVNTAGALVEMGKRVLVIDLDGQGSLSSALGIKPTQLEKLKKNIYNTLVDEDPIENCILKIREELHLAPAHEYLYVADAQTAQEWGREYNLSKALDTVRDKYDFVLIDCPPALGFLTVSGLTASDGVVIPMSTDQLSMLGVNLLLKTIARVQDKLNPTLKVTGILPTRHLKQTNNANEVLELVHSHFGKTHHVFQSVIHETIRMREAPVIGKTIMEYNPDHPSASDYRAFAKELLEHV